MEWKNNKPCGDALIVEMENVLLVQRAVEPYAGFWATPGGHCDFGEHPVLTAERELREETGIKVFGGTDKFFGIYMDLVSDDDCRQVTVYTFRTVRGIVTPSYPECLDARWWPLDSLPAMSPLARRIMTDYGR